MSELYKKIGESGYDQLLADPQGADVIAVPCEPGNGDIKRGTILYRKASGLWAPAAAAQIVNTNQLVVLNEDVATGNAPASGTTVTAEDAAAYRAGRFIKVILRQQGIVFDQKENTSTFTNTVTGA